MWGLYTNKVGTKLDIESLAGEDGPARPVLEVVLSESILVQGCPEATYAYVIPFDTVTPPPNVWQV